jgi:hypothetical protein
MRRLWLPTHRRHLLRDARQVEMRQVWQRVSRWISGMHSSPQGARNGTEWTPPHHPRWGFRAPTVIVVEGLRVLQANCRKSPDCTTTFLQKARGRGDVLLLQEFWADPRTDNGMWKLVQDGNFRYFFDGSIKAKSKKPRAMIALSVNPRVDFEVVCLDRDLVAVWVGTGPDKVMVVSLYNPNPDPNRSGPMKGRKLFQTLSGVRDWVVGGDFNAHHPASPPSLVGKCRHQESAGNPRAAGKGRFENRARHPDPTTKR